MSTCKICGRKFKSKEALGGHMSNAHPKQATNPTASTEQVALPQNAGEEPIAQKLQSTEAKGQVALLEGGVDKRESVLVQEDETIAEEIRGYLRCGYNFEQLTKELHFKDKTVRQEIAKLVSPKGNELGKVGDGLPATRKMGGGAEVTNPEALLRSYMDGSNSDMLELRGMMKLRAAMLMVMDLVNIRKANSDAYALMVKPILEMMKETREEQDAAAERAKASSAEIARDTAHQTALEMADFIDSKMPKGPPPKDVNEIFTKRIDKMWEMMDHVMEQRMMPGYQQGKVPEGWESEKRRSE